MTFISTYSDLQTAMEEWLRREDVTTAKKQQFIHMGEFTMRNDLRLRSVGLQADVDLSLSSRSVSLPSRFLGMRRDPYLSLSTVKRLNYMVPNDYWGRWGSSATGEPKFYTIEGTTMHVGPVPDGAYTGKAHIFQAPDFLSDSNTSNVYLSELGPMLLYASLIHAEPYLNNEGKTMAWATLYDTQAEMIEEAEERKRRGTGMKRYSEYTIR